MKIKRFFKIILLICCLALTSIFIVLMYTVIILENNPFEYSMLIPLSIISTGVLSIIYHIKTLKHYSINYVYKDLNDSFLWVGNLLFAISISLMALFMIYSFYSMREIDLNPKLFYAFVFCGVILLIGVVLILEEKWLYKKRLIIKKQSKINKIDDIRGTQDDEL